MAPQTVTPVPDDITPDRLLLDPNNPRLGGHHFELRDQEGIIQSLWQNNAVDELVGSIAQNGYWRHEELFAIRVDDDLIVVEGNRRLAAVKLLLDPSLAARLRIPLPNLTDEVRDSLGTLPVIFTQRDRIWEYIGFKHVNGPQEWDSLAKAEYIFQVHTEFEIPLDEIALTIGDKHDTVKRLYRGFVVLKQAQDEELFAIGDATSARFPFSHLWTALGYTNVQTFLGIEGESILAPNPVPQSHQENLQHLMWWLFGSRQLGREPKVRRQNPDLRNLADVLGNPRAVNVLKSDLPLSVAFDASLGDMYLFRDALINAENLLRTASSYVATGFRGELELMQSVATMIMMLRSIDAAMRDIRQRSEELED